MTKLLNQKGGSKEIWELDLYWKSRQAFNTANMGLNFELRPWIKTILNLGSVYLMEQSNMWSILFKTTQIPADPQEKQVSQTSSSVVATRSKAKPQPRDSIGITITITWKKMDGCWTIKAKCRVAQFVEKKKIINLLRHNQKLHREQDGAVQFYKIKFYLRDYSLSTQNWSDNRWKAPLVAGGGSKRRYQYCSDYLGSIIYFRALQRHSGGNLIDPALQDIVLIGLGYFVAFTKKEAISIFVQLSAMDWYLEVRI